MHNSYFLPITIAYIPQGGTPTSLPTFRTIWSLLSNTSSTDDFVAGICSGAMVVGTSAMIHCKKKIALAECTTRALFPSCTPEKLWLMKWKFINCGKRQGKRVTYLGLVLSMRWPIDVMQWSGPLVLLWFLHLSLPSSEQREGLSLQWEPFCNKNKKLCQIYSQEVFFVIFFAFRSTDK